MRAYVSNVSLLAAPSPLVLVTSGAVNTRAMETKHTCNVDLAGLHAESMRAFEDAMATRPQRRGAALDVFAAAYSWLDLQAPDEPFAPACEGQRRHCTCLGKRTPEENDRLWPAGAMPTCELQARAIALTTLKVHRR